MEKFSRKNCAKIVIVPVAGHKKTVRQGDGQKVMRRHADGKEVKITYPYRMQEKNR